MKQIVQDLKKGKMRILEAPYPALPEGGVLVRSHYSVISAGTEGRTVSDARKGYVAKARSRQKEVRQILQSVRTQGMLATYKLVMNKLDAPSSLGYSCAGEVIAVGRNVREFRVGDQVACGGPGASHAEIVAVAKNLCAKVPQAVDLKDAAFATIAAIAMQGMRQADLRLGESAVVIGLGLVGQITMQLLRAAGGTAIGIDIDPHAVALARKTGFTNSFSRDHAGLEQRISKITAGLGADAVIITASTSSLDPINLAGRLCRHKGRVVVVGGVPTGYDRADFYRKELDLRMSSSYGPGRYDPQYEEKGIDYPPGYVRWTENRNMQAYLAMLAEKKIDISKLITHEFALEKAPDAYALILGRRKPFCGIVLTYDAHKKHEGRVTLREVRRKATEPRIGFIGAGAYAQNLLLPAVKAAKIGEMVGVATARPNNARYVADKHGFAYCTGDADEIIADPRINTVFIATRHDSHARYVIAALKSGKNVFVEKPLCLNDEELKAISAVVESRNRGHEPGILMVGYNRRFSPLVERMMAMLPKGLPKAINYQIIAGILPPSHWVHDPAVGGGRIIGEACHFVDLSLFIAQSPIIQASAQVMPTPDNLNDTVMINLGYADGSMASISYLSNGNPRLPKERLEVSCAGSSFTITDFKTIVTFGQRISSEALRKQDKGHYGEVKQYLRAVEQGGASPIAFADLRLVSSAMFRIVEAFQSKTVVRFE